MNAVPIALCAAAANSQYSALVFHCRGVDVVFVVAHVVTNLSAVTDRRYSKRSFVAAYAAELRVARTRYEVIVDHAGCLHKRIADCRTDKFESASQQIATHDVGFGCARGHLGHGSPAILNWFAIDEAPHLSIASSDFFA